ncbi:hypothetical protein BDN72DRAFT_876511 [Pluteus cervinus]|uniref:Uncharacterized protein n=1 Tax=Pluteus cervinus TaxID=181527 RepID=A0ACD3B3A4_9AGAR|nr:hypothetical protein BDN72DRAFT_876511 [Pluteus cervinus]
MMTRARIRGERGGWRKGRKQTRHVAGKLDNFSTKSKKMSRSIGVPVCRPAYQPGNRGSTKVGNVLNTAYRWANTSEFRLISVHSATFNAAPSQEQLVIIEYANGSEFRTSGKACEENLSIKNLSVPNFRGNGERRHEQLSCTDFHTYAVFNRQLGKPGKKHRQTHGICPDPPNSGQPGEESRTPKDNWYDEPPKRNWYDEPGPRMGRNDWVEAELKRTQDALEGTKKQLELMKRELEHERDKNEVLEDKLLETMKAVRMAKRAMDEQQSELEEMGERVRNLKKKAGGGGKGKRDDSDDKDVSMAFMETGIRASFLLAKILADVLTD